MTLVLRVASEADAALLFEWRNDPVTREQSRTSDPIAWDDHVAWLKRTLVSIRRAILIAEEDGKPVGTVRVDFGDKPSCELSWTVAPNERRRGIGRAMVAAAIERLAGITVTAEIKPGNVPSLRIARSLGFTRVRKRGGDITAWRRSAHVDRRAPSNDDVRACAKS